MSHIDLKVNINIRILNIILVILNDILHSFMYNCNIYKN